MKPENTDTPQKADCPSASCSTLADRLYAALKDEDALFESVSKIMGCDVSECLADGFKFAVHDTFWDDYDSSVEVILDESTPWMTDDQALKILGLGFGKIYASRGREMENIGHQYSAPGVKVPGKLTRHLYKEGRSRAGSEDNRWRAKYLALQSEISRPTTKTRHERRTKND